LEAVMSEEASVARHYARPGLDDAIVAALTASGKDIAHVATRDLAPVDEFHTGGRQATDDLAQAMALRPGMRLLDIGSGIGGPARHFAETYGCSVVGIDLTPDYVQAAVRLTALVGLEGRVSFETGSALALPFAAQSFDAATEIHVGMNIADKARLFAEVRRVLRPGGVFGIFDVMGDGAFGFPVPWADTEEASAVDTVATYRRLLATAGFAVAAERSRRDVALEFFARAAAQAGQGGPPPLGLHLVMGPSLRQKIANLVRAITDGALAPWELICRAI
jgi:SAM-dependent methyltransferase